jgi:fimbrial isopeptide formation D2 family protein/LPXTG-motif cell wall-anchored protein
MKKLFAVLLTLTLVLSMGTIALAADTGTITIDNALSGAKYNIYKILDFAPVEGSTTQGRYTVVTEWADFLAGDGAAYLKTNAETGTIEWNGEATDARKAELAKAAVAYAKEKGIAATATKTAANDGDVTFTDVPLGYYAIDTSLGTICALTNVDNTFNAHEKNEKPDIDKFVQEDSEMNNADEGWGKVNDADIDQVVNYKSTITVGVGATNYVMHDTMEAGLTFNNDVVVKFADGTEVNPANYTVTVSPADGHTFDVAFNNDFIAGLTQGTQFTVYYSATLNEKANIVVDGNDNTVYLSYGEDSTWETAEHKTTTYTWKMDVLKYTMDGENKVSLAGAKFQLLDKDGNAIKFTEVAGATVPTYKVDAEGTVTEITTDENGKFELVGLDEGSYKLRETAAPAGYNKLAADIDVIITSTYDEAALTATYEINDETPATIEVENKTGSLLPETGGIGTTIFYVVGGLLMAAAFILLVSKKRMANFA